MAQPQPAPSVPEYPHPNDVEDAKRDAPTPEREGFDAIVVQPGQDIVGSVLLDRPTQPAFDPGYQLVALRNRDNLCYRNAVLHSLFSIDYFHNLLDYGCQLTGNLLIYRHLLDAAHAFRAGVGQRQQLEHATYSAWLVLLHSPPNNINSTQEAFSVRGGDQQDAGDFFHYLMERLCESELSDILIDTVNPILKRIFTNRLALRRVFPCDHNKQKARLDNQEHGDNFSFAVNVESGRNINTLSDCISNKMYNPYAANESHECSQCGAGTRATGYFAKFYKLPELLPIEVHYTDQNDRPDFQSKVDIPEKLDLSRLCDSDSDKALSMYTLQAAILYRGNANPAVQRGRAATTSGHFVSYIRRGDGNGWILLDDNIALSSSTRTGAQGGQQRVRTSRFEAINNTVNFQPRLMFYTRDRDPQPRAETPEQTSARLAREQAARDQAARDQAIRDQAAAARAERARAAASTGSRVIDVGFRPTRYSGATQGAAPQSQGRCNCGGAGRQSGGSGRSRSGGGGSSQAEGSGSSHGSPEDNNGGEHDADDGHDDGGDDDGDDDDDDGDDDGFDDDLGFPPPPGDEPDDYDQRETWDEDTWKARYRDAFKIGIPTKISKEDLIFRIQQHWRPTEPRVWSHYGAHILRNELRDRGWRDANNRVINADTLERHDWRQWLDRLKNARIDLQTRRQQLQQQRQRLRNQRISRSQQSQQGRQSQQRAATGSVATSPGAGPGTSQDPPNDDPDQALVDGIAQLEQLINDLQERACRCPLNGRSSLPVDDMRNGLGTPHRALQVRAAAQGAAADQTTSPPDYWIPLPPELDRQGMRLRIEVNVGHPAANSNNRMVRVDLSGPETAAAGHSPDEDNAALPPFMNWFEFEVPFAVTAENVRVEAWQDDMTNVPLMANRTFRLNQGQAGRRRIGGTPPGGGGGRRGDSSDDDNHGDSSDSGSDNSGRTNPRTPPGSPPPSDPQTPGENPAGDNPSGGGGDGGGDESQNIEGTQPGGQNPRNNPTTPAKQSTSSGNAPTSELSDFSTPSDWPTYLERLQEEAALASARDAAVQAAGLGSLPSRRSAEEAGLDSDDQTDNTPNGRARSRPRLEYDPGDWPTASSPYRFGTTRLNGTGMAAARNVLGNDGLPSDAERSSINSLSELFVTPWTTPEGRLVNGALSRVRGVVPYVASATPSQGTSSSPGR
ncbi:hypothetical protein J7T55_013741 [Diaporthe amygdali]|uniref:uncharacterized protein n=1 Tax=Phomopsis amygdali TaxID=1214568 RepID=UPI0022FED468|nr:uncharacterized protein J7T55_013741 [Diaporthe amygdali]KAJ0119538.1 hypothetical protein J7T55_013741 [Diaporthe amygdali]